MNEEKPNFAAQRIGRRIQRDRLQRDEDFKPENRNTDLITLEITWNHLLPKFAVPRERFLRSWLNRASVEQITAAMEETRRAAHKLQSDEHAGAFCASRLNVRVDRAKGLKAPADHSRALHFNEDGQCSR
jgi:hypothetical protein